MMMMVTELSQTSEVLDKVNEIGGVVPDIIIPEPKSWPR